jgi:hypothetical protein
MGTWRASCDADSRTRMERMLMAENNRQNTDDQPGRDRYRDNDDVRHPLEGDAKTGGSADTRSEARGGARETVGNNARGTDADPIGPEGNDKQKHRPRSDEFNEDLNRDNRR